MIGEDDVSRLNGQRETLVSLKEHLEDRIDHERELRVHAQEALALALQLQAIEYERRLETLNHEAARLKTAADKAVLVDVYNAQRSADLGRVTILENADIARSTLDGERVKSSSRTMWGIGLAASAIGVVVSVILKFL